MKIKEKTKMKIKRAYKELCDYYSDEELSCTISELDYFSNGNLRIVSFAVQCLRNNKMIGDRRTTKLALRLVQGVENMLNNASRYSVQRLVNELSVPYYYRNNKIKLNI